jgi:uncharacterized protein YoxC
MSPVWIIVIAIAIATLVICSTIGDAANAICSKLDDLKSKLGVIDKDLERLDAKLNLILDEIRPKIDPDIGPF